MSKHMTFTLLIIVLVTCLVACSFNKNWSDIENSITNPGGKINNTSDTLSVTEADADSTNELFLVPKSSAIKDFLGHDLTITICNNGGVEEVSLASPLNTNSFDYDHDEEITGFIEGISIKIDHEKEGSTVRKIIFTFSNGKKIICERRGS